MYFARKSDKFTKPAESLRKENEEKFSLQAMDQKLWGILDKYVPKFATENSFVLPKLKSINNLTAMITFAYAGHLDLVDTPLTVQSICATSYNNQELIEFMAKLSSISKVIDIDQLATQG